jgi:hypothetical protein
MPAISHSSYRHGFGSEKNIGTTEPTTYSMEPSTCLEYYSLSAGQEISRHKWNTKFHCYVHSSPLLDPTLEN